MNLLTDQGIYSIIVANKWLRTGYGLPLRRYLKKQRIHEIVDFGDLPIFQGISTYPCVMKISKGDPSDFWCVQTQKSSGIPLESISADLPSFIKKHRYKVALETLADESWSISPIAEAKLFEKIKNTGVPLGEYLQKKIYRGLLTGLNEAFVVDEQTKIKLVKDDPKCSKIIKPFLEGKDIKKYAGSPIRKWLILFPNGWTAKNGKSSEKEGWLFIEKTYPSIARWLSQFEKPAKARYDQGAYWWELRACDYYGEFEKTKIFIPAISPGPAFAFDESGTYSNNKTSILVTGEKYLLAVLNSRVMGYFISKNSTTKLGGYFDLEPRYLQALPIPPVSEIQKGNLAQFADSMLALNKKLNQQESPLTEGQVQKLRDDIVYTDKQIDKLVYELYNLTPAEIKIVEESA